MYSDFSLHVFKFYVAITADKLWYYVFTGVLLHNENKSDDMIKIVNHLHQYVPLVV